jgi:6-pyruvoyltetrahydropterin/6-carboxytetrahydropterin synthase
LRGIQPTTEQVAVAIWERLQPVLAAAGCTLHSVRLHETENNSASYYGE